MLSDIKTGRRSHGIEGYGEGPLWRRRLALGCGANEEEEEEEEEEEVLTRLILLNRQLTKH